mmetsp:Transcript_62207/g.203001  ORF Transcript_62207/g.203001 Transcript_62207/m.203001 type:complete len:1085 (+) Transcript_62207:3-3257(+)
MPAPAMPVVSPSLQLQRVVSSALAHAPTVALTDIDYARDLVFHELGSAAEVAEKHGTLVVLSLAPWIAFQLRAQILGVVPGIRVQFETKFVNDTKVVLRVDFPRTVEDNMRHKAKPVSAISPVPVAHSMVVVQKKATADPRTAEFFEVMHPLTFAQIHMLCSHMLADVGSSAFNEVIAVELEVAESAVAVGARSSFVSILNDALRKLTARHEILRSTFDPGELTQRIAPPPLPSGIGDGNKWLQEEETDSLEAAWAEVASMSKTPFPLDIVNGRAPVLRAKLMCVRDTTKAVLVLGLPHMATDGMSISVLISNLEAVCKGEELPPLPLQHVDLAVWQQQQLNSGKFAESVDFWFQYLKEGQEEVFTVPTDKPRPRSVATANGTVPLAMPAGVMASLRQRVKDLRISMFQLWVFFFGMALLKQAGSDESRASVPVLIGTAYHGRDWEELVPVMGFFVHQLVLRVQLPPSMDAREALANTVESCKLAVKHGRVMPTDTAFHEKRKNCPRVAALLAVAGGRWLQRRGQGGGGGAGAGESASSQSRMGPEPQIKDVRWAAGSDSKADFFLTVDLDDAQRYGGLLYDSAIFAPERAAQMAKCLFDLATAAATAGTGPPHPESWPPPGSTVATLYPAIEEQPQQRAEDQAETISAAAAAAAPATAAETLLAAVAAALAAAAVAPDAEPAAEVLAAALAAARAAALPAAAAAAPAAAAASPAAEPAPAAHEEEGAAEEEEEEEEWYAMIKRPMSEDELDEAVQAQCQLVIAMRAKTKKVPRGVSLHKIGFDCSIGPGVVFKGPVVIGDYVRMRGNIHIGAGCKFDDCTTVFCDKGEQIDIGSGCKICLDAKVDGDVRLGDGCKVYAKVLLKGPIQAGDYNVFDRGCFIGVRNRAIHGEVRIGNNCFFGDGVHVLQPRGKMSPAWDDDEDETPFHSVTSIGDNVSVRASIGNDSVIEDNCVIERALPAHTHMMQGSKVRGGPMLTDFMFLGRGCVVQEDADCKNDLPPLTTVGTDPTIFRLDADALTAHGAVDSDVRELDEFYREHFGFESLELPEKAMLASQGKWFQGLMEDFITTRRNRRQIRLLAQYER